MAEMILNPLPLPFLVREFIGLNDEELGLPGTSPLSQSRSIPVPEPSSRRRAEEMLHHPLKPEESCSDGQPRRGSS